MRIKNAAVANIVRKASEESLSDAQALFNSMLNGYAGAPAAELGVLLSALKALAVVHQSHHWQTRGVTYYGDHLLFERIYGNVDGEVDGIAEKAVGFGPHLLVQPIVVSTHQLMVLKWLYSGAPVDPDPQQYVNLSLRAEYGFMVLLHLAYAGLEKSGLLSLGVDNRLQGIADKHEENIYLLQQRAGQRQASALSWKAT